MTLLILYLLGLVTGKALLGQASPLGSTPSAQPLPGMAPKPASQLLTAVTPPFPLTGVTPKTRSQLMMPSAGLLLPLASPMPSSGVPLKLLRLFHARSAFLPPVGAADQLQFN